MIPEWKIGELKIKSRVVVAPMAGVSNPAFRKIAKKAGAGLLVSEMVSDQGIHFRNKKTLAMLHIDQEEHPISVQIFGGSKAGLLEAAQFVAANTQADIIDLNLGCPVNKIVKSQAGAKWLLDPDKLYEMVQAISSSVALPVTVKMRTGWDEKHILALENARAAQAGGAKAIAMHGRTRAQMYKGKADWSILKQVKQNISVPFIGNGDIRTAEDAKYMLEEIGCDAVMIGRAVLGDPWLIKRINHYLKTGELIAEPSTREKIAMAQEHLVNLVELKGEKVACQEFRTHLPYYLKGISGAAKIKVAVNQAEHYQTIEHLLTEFLTSS